jgi:hypothetical protein
VAAAGAEQELAGSIALRIVLATECQCVKSHFAAKRSSLWFGKSLQGLFLWLMLLVEGIPQTAEMARFDPQAAADLFQGSSVVYAVHGL